MNFYELEEKVIQWADQKGILEKATPLAQANKTLEEVNELLFALTLRDKYDTSQLSCLNDYNEKVLIFNSEEEIKDAFGDILVTIIIGAELNGLKLTDCLESAYDVIKNRTGKMINGQFKKD